MKILNKLIHPKTEWQEFKDSDFKGIYTYLHNQLGEKLQTWWVMSFSFTYQ